MTKINSANPVDLHIENQFKYQATPVLYIVSHVRHDDATQHVLFRFQNISNEGYWMRAMNVADRAHFHFALAFRPGTLHYTDLEVLRQQFATAIGDAWNVSTLDKDLEDHAEVIYFSSKNDFFFGAKTELNFMVYGLSAAGGTGTRSTQVQFRCNLELDSGGRFTAIRNRHLDIINHDGKTYAPLGFTILGNPGVAHKTEENQLGIQLLELKGRDIDVGPETFIDFKFPYYSGDYDPDYHPSWVFGRQSQVERIICSRDPEETTNITVDATGEDINYSKWGYKNIRVRFTSAEQINNLILRFDHVPGFGPIGDARIQVSIHNLPGYWDTEFEIDVHKRLVNYRHQSDENYYSEIKDGLTVLGDVNIGGHQNRHLKARHVDGKHHENEEKDLLFLNFNTGKDVHVGAAEVESDLYVWGGITTSNDVNIGGAHNRHLRVRHVDGKHYDNANIDHLFLNFNTGMNVHVGGGGKQSDLHIDGKLTTTDDVNIGGSFNRRLRTRHIDGKHHENAEADMLFLNFDTGKDVWIGNEQNESNLKVHGRVQDAKGQVMPVGGIIMWSGNIGQIPEGWELCNGQNGTPDLRDRFIVGTGSFHAHQSTGGKTHHVLTVDEMPAHSHTITNYNANFDHEGRAAEGSPKDDGDGVFHTQTSSVGNNIPHENRPPYYTMAFIMKQ